MLLTCFAPLHTGVHQTISATNHWLWARKWIREKGSPAVELCHQATRPARAQRAPITNSTHHQWMLWQGEILVKSPDPGWLQAFVYLGW